MSDDKTYTKAELEAAIAAAKEAQDEKNRELLAEVKDLKAKVRASQEIKPEDLTAMEQRAEKAEAALAEANKNLKALTTERDKAAKDLDRANASLHNHLVENGLRAQLAAVGVTNPVHQKAAIAMHRNSVEVVMDGDQHLARVGDKALADFVKEWAAGEEGKHFVSAPANGGGGAQGSSAAAGGKTITRDAYDALSIPEQAQIGMAAAKGEISIIDQAA